MTEEEIFEIAKTFGIVANKYKICISWGEEMLKFARAIYEKGNEVGYREGYEALK